METGIYVAISSQVALEKRLDTIADNMANVNTVGFRATEVKFNQALEKARGDSREKISFVTKGDEYLSSNKGAFNKTGNPLDFAIKGSGYFMIDTPQGKALTRDGRFDISSSGALVTIDNNPVLDAGGAAIQLNLNEGPPNLSPNGGLYQNGKLVATLGVYTAKVDRDYIRVGNSAIIPADQPEPVLDRNDVGVSQGYVEESNVNAVLELTQLIDVQRNFEQVSNFLKGSNNSLMDAIKTIGGR